MKAIVYLHYLEDTAKKNKFEVRRVNSWTAYDWLSKATTSKITKTMELRKANATVHDLLRVALLLEHGGVMINQADTFFFENGFKWIESMLSGSSSSKDHTCESTDTKILLAQDEHPYFRIKYSSAFIAVKSGNNLLKEVFEEMMFFYKQGRF